MRFSDGARSFDGLQIFEWSLNLFIELDYFVVCGDTDGCLDGT